MGKLKVFISLTLLLLFIPAQAGELESVLYQELGAGMKSGLDQLYKFIKATDIKVGQPLIKIKKGFLSAKVNGSYKYKGQRLNASYATIWREKRGCIFVDWLEFRAEGDQNIVGLINQGLKAMYEGKCESKDYIRNVIKAAWVLQ